MAPSGLLVTGASFAAFRGLHWGLQLLPTPGSAAQDRWKWRNICVSLVHSLLTGVGALLGLSLYPQMAADPIHGHPPWALVLVAISVGYFLADGADMLWNQTLGQAWELLCHHLVVVSCLSSAILSGHYVGFSVVSLLLELNSTCLHLRKLLLLSRQAPSLAFSVTSWATLATLALFRLVPLGWMSLWLIRQHHQVPIALVILGGTGLVTVGATSITLGVRILVSDVLRSRPRPPIPEHKETKGIRTCCDGEPVTRDDSTLSLKD
ncbi:TLC domain-containing protein 2 [Neophocaena asiaeorientalis asiaeorientalis]|uniref:TLC domain-containing protein 2 n=1 Tax=Neophocaena asiaeorientalis asiaeorientalis TaxID=1706337 RepID=A0A341AMI2_NEOAA|nr:TLC domain-containing protein 2 [Neophocaena asiaeorientalis asiaeorientalis]